MKAFKICLKVLVNVQILSALIWAFVIIGCSYVSANDRIAMILTTAAGFHVILLSQLTKK